MPFAYLQDRDCSGAADLFACSVVITERNGRLACSFLLFFSFCFLNPAACVHPASFAGWITGEKRRPQSERPKQGTVPGGLPLPFLTLHFLLVQKAIPKKLGFVVSSPRPKASPALPCFFPKVTSFSHSREPDLPQIIFRKGGGRSVPTTKGDPGSRDRPTGSVPDSARPGDHHQFACPALQTGWESLTGIDSRDCDPGGDLCTDSSFGVSAD